MEILKLCTPPPPPSRNPGYAPAKDIDALERVQRRFTKSFSNIRSLPYSTRLTRLDLQPLYVRRNHIDLITCFRLIHGFTHLDNTSFFSPRLNSVTRGHPYTLIKPPVRLNTSKFSFFLAPSTIGTICLLVPSLQVHCPLSNLSWSIHKSLNLFYFLDFHCLNSLASCFIFMFYVFCIHFIYYLFIWNVIIELLFIQLYLFSCKLHFFSISTLCTFYFSFCKL